jgi:cytochrome c oxidase cbb3-type subunit I/II
MIAFTEKIALPTANPNVEHFEYDNKIVRNFALASIIFAIVGLLVGL